MPTPLVHLSVEAVRQHTARTIAHYEGRAEAFWSGTRDHDVSQNIAALLKHLAADKGRVILDLGCGPGRDLLAFRELGHAPIGLDASPTFVAMARAHSGCEVWHQDMLSLDLPDQRFDGVFANASLFHVPSQELARVLSELRCALKPGGVLLASNPTGPDSEGSAHDERYACHLRLETWREFVSAAGLVELEHYYRPVGLPRAQQPWLVTVSRVVNG